MLDLENPTTLIIVNILGVGMLGILTAFGKWYGKQGHGGGGGPQHATKDVVVPALTIADNQLIAEQIKTLREANERGRDREQFERQMLELAKDNINLEREKISVQREILTYTKQAAEYQREAAASLERIERNQNPPSPPRR